MNDHTTLPEFITLSARNKDLTGQRFGRLLALGPVGRTPTKRVTLWLCRCDCGNTSIVQRDNLCSGSTKSCGCYIRDITSQRSIVHGMAGKPYFSVWQDMTQRCTNPNSSAYNGYGGRGITVYDGWRYDPKAFCDYVSQLPHAGDKGYTLDRIDNNGNYEPGNVRWATVKQQNHNRRNNRMITYKGKTQCLAAWADEFHMEIHTLWSRLKRGWSTERALTTPVKASKFKGARRCA